MGHLQLGLLGLLLLAAASFSCSAADHLQTKRSSTSFVSGESECIDCAAKNVDSSLAFIGLNVAVKCKKNNGDYEMKGITKLDENGRYKLQLPSDLVDDYGELKQECIAQLHNFTNGLCPEQDGTKIALKFKKDGGHIFSTNGKLPFSFRTCTSAFFYPKSKITPPLPKWPHFKKPLPSLGFPPKPSLHPIYKPPVPIYKTPVPTKKPFPLVPIVKPLHPPVPIVKPLPPPVPIYKPTISKKPLPPFHKFPPIYKKQLPPLPKFSPIYKKPLPPPPKFSHIYKKPIPHLPKYPPMH